MAPTSNQGLCVPSISATSLPQVSWLRRCSSWRLGRSRARITLDPRPPQEPRAEYRPDHGQLGEIPVDRCALVLELARGDEHHQQDDEQRLRQPREVSLADVEPHDEVQPADDQRHRRVDHAIPCRRENPRRQGTSPHRRACRRCRRHRRWADQRRRAIATMATVINALASSLTRPKGIICEGVALRHAAEHHRHQAAAEEQRELPDEREGQHVRGLRQVGHGQNRCAEQQRCPRSSERASIGVPVKYGTTSRSTVLIGAAPGRSPRGRALRLPR